MSSLIEELIKLRQDGQKGKAREKEGHSMLDIPRGYQAMSISDSIERVYCDSDNYTEKKKVYSTVFNYARKRF